MFTHHISRKLYIAFIYVSLLIHPSLSYATLYNVSGNFWGADGAEVYGTMSINDSFSQSTIEMAWENYLTTPTTDNFFLELEYQITSFELYRTDTDERYFFGNDGFIEIIVYGHQGDATPNSTGYNAWSLHGSGTVNSAYSGRNSSDVRFSNNGTNISDIEYDQLAQTILLNSGCYNDDDYTGVSMTLTAGSPIPEPSSIILFGFGLGFLFLARQTISV